MTHSPLTNKQSGAIVVRRGPKVVARAAPMKSSLQGTQGMARFVRSVLRTAGLDVQTCTQISDLLHAAQAKPSNPLAVWRRLKLDTVGTVTLRSRKLRWWLLTLDLEAQANPRLQTSNVSFRVATKWDMYRGQIRNKKRVHLGSATEARIHYSVNYNLPEIEG